MAIDDPPPTWVFASSTVFSGLVILGGLLFYNRLNTLIQSTNSSGQHPNVQMFLYTQMALFTFSSIVCVSLMWVSTDRNDWAAAAWVFVVIPPFFIVFFVVALLCVYNDWNEPIDQARAMAPKDPPKDTSRELQRMYHVVAGSLPPNADPTQEHEEMHHTGTTPLRQGSMSGGGGYFSGQSTPGDRTPPTMMSAQRQQQSRR
eukprot:PhF_6_TR8881/c1_g1_i2/m.14051